MSADTPQYLSLRQASQRFGPSVAMLDRLIRDGILPAVRFSSRGKKWVKPEDVERCAKAAATPMTPERWDAMKERMRQIANETIAEHRQRRATELH